jgi:hypothetical protein
VPSAPLSRCSVSDPAFLDDELRQAVGDFVDLCANDVIARDADRPPDELLASIDHPLSQLKRVEQLSGLARNFGDVFGAGSGSERAVGVIVGGDALE